MLKTQKNIADRYYRLQAITTHSLAFKKYLSVLRSIVAINMQPKTCTFNFFIQNKLTLNKNVKSMGKVTSCQLWNTLQTLTKPREVPGARQHCLAQERELREEGAWTPETCHVTPTCSRG